MSSEFDYHSEQINSKNNKTRKNIVNIINNKGIKRVEEYDNQGKLLHKREKALTKPQIHKIKNNIFIPGLFKDCCAQQPQQSLRSKTRRTNRRRN